MISTRASLSPIAVAAIILSLLAPIPQALAQEAARTQPQPAPRPPSTPVPVLSGEALARHIGAAIARACPPAAPSDSNARNAATEALTREIEIVDSMDSHIGWGQPDASGRPPPEARLTRLVPLAFARLYLSLFCVSAPPAVRTENGLIMLELPVTFRSDLRSDEYPEPIWETPEWWRSYAGTTALLLVFQDDVLVNALRRVDQNVALPEGTEALRTKKRGEGGLARPSPERPSTLRGASYEYLLWSESPYVRDLTAIHRQLLSHFTAEGCTACHAPSAEGRAVILTLPAQALVAGSVLKSVLHDAEGAAGPRASHCPSPRVNDPAALKEMRRLTDKFAELTDDALAFESARRAAPGPP